jgi:hypothetical protein
MIPEKRSELFARALHGESRVIVGAHYPSDYRGWQGRHCWHGAAHAECNQRQFFEAVRLVRR